MLAQLLRRGRGGVCVNLEDPRLYGLEPRDFPTFLAALEARFPSGAIGLDEVQEAREWERLVRALLDRGRAVVVTGSNASLLGREVGTKLTGRHLSFEVSPFSYPEYLACRGLPAGEESFRGHLDEGGFPGYLREGNPNILRELLRDVMQRDIASRHCVRQMRHFMNLALFLLANTGLPFSLQRLTKSLSVPTVGQTSRYVEYLQDAYLLFALPKFSPSFRRRVASPCKYYAVDNGLRRANAPQEQPDWGRRLENAVYLALRRTDCRLAYAGERDLWECDFVTDSCAVQVCAELTEENRAREIGGLLRALRIAPRRRPLLITLRQEQKIREEGVEISVLPAWKWLAGDRKLGDVVNL